MKSILIIDDEDDIREILSYNLKKEGFQVDTASNGMEGIEKARKATPDLILLDVMMPEMDGIEVCEVLRNDNLTKDVSICFLTARNEDYSQIAGFEAGGDDYVSKPIKPRVLVSRIKALLRRTEGKSANQDKKDEFLVIDREQYLVFKEGEEIQFPKKEFELLALLASKPGKVFERDVILEKVWGDGVVVGDRTIDVHIRKLREKLGGDCIKTVKGVGYTYRHQ